MKRYYIALIILTAVLVLACFCTFWISHEIFIILPFLPLYFAVITGLQHYAINKSFYKDPRTFVKNFMGLTVGSLFLHLIVISIWAFTHTDTARAFIIAFLICYIAYLVFETISLVLLVKSKQK